MFGEYRFTDSFALNATVRYTANFSSNSVPDRRSGGANAPVPAAQQYDMSWNRLEAYLGCPWFL